MAKKENNEKETNKSKQLQPKEYEKLILDYVKQFPSGLTIADISKPKDEEGEEEGGLGISRITVSKYISVLEAKNKVLSKSIGAYTLYLPVEKTLVPWRSAVSFVQGFLSGLAKEIVFANSPSIFDNF